jgi:hypothetical protein
VWFSFSFFFGAFDLSHRVTPTGGVVDADPWRFLPISRRTKKREKFRAIGIKNSNSEIEILRSYFLGIHSLDSWRKDFLVRERKSGHGLLLGKKMALAVPVGSVPCRVCVSRIIVIVQPNRKTCLRSKTSNFKLWRSFLFGLFFHFHFILFVLLLLLFLGFGVWCVG